MRVSFAGAVGGDAAGQAQIEELAREGVEVSGMVVDETHESVVSVILVDRANGSRTIFSSTGARPRFPAVPDLPDPAPHLLLLDTWMGAESVELAKNARAAGAHVLLDAGTLREDWREFVGVSDYAIVSEPFADALSGAGETEAALACLLARGPSHAAVTRGAKGVVAARKGSPEVLRVPAFEVRAVDTTGAGDAFHAGTAWGLLRGLPWEDSLIAGAAVAALKCRVAGGRMGLPKEEEVQKLLRTTPRADLDR
jgi:sugar/nucleoside kinase (ribokinase family)